MPVSDPMPSKTQVRSWYSKLPVPSWRAQAVVSKTRAGNDTFMVIIH